MSFHQFRRSFWPQGNFANRLWSYHDRNPLSPWLNLKIRNLLYYYRLITIRKKSRKKDFIYGQDKSLTVAPRLYLLKSKDNKKPLNNHLVQARFKYVHSLNELLYCSNGAWAPQPLSEYYGKGISIEEVALRVRGYLSAYRAMNESIYLQRAIEGCDYLLAERIFEDGHILLQGHMTIDLPYAFAGEALLQLWKFDKSKRNYLAKAVKIGDRLMEYQVAGSVNHAVVPVQFLAQLYQVTGEKKYLKNSLKRLARTALPMQLPYGGWLGHESWIWYHALILRSLVIGYVSLPNTLEYYAKRDKIACSITAAMNRFFLCQNKQGAFPIRPPEPICESTDEEIHLGQKAVYDEEKGFVKILDRGISYGSWNGYVIDTLVTAYELLDMKEVVPYLTDYARNIVSTKNIWRLEFDTLGAGRILEYVEFLAPQRKDKIGDNAIESEIYDVNS